MKSSGSIGSQSPQNVNRRGGPKAEGGMTDGKKVSSENANAASLAMVGKLSKQAETGLGTESGVPTLAPAAVAAALEVPTPAPAEVAAEVAAEPGVPTGATTVEPDSSAGKASSLGGAEDAGTSKIDKARAMEIVSTDGLQLKDLPAEFKGDEAVVMTAVNQNGMALQFASKTLKENEEVVLAAVEQKPAALQFASEDCVALKCMDNGMLLEHAGEFQSNELVVKCAINSDINALQFATEQCVLGLISNGDVGLDDAFSHAKEAVQDKLRTSFEVQESAIKKDRMQLAHATRDVVLKMVAEDGMLLEYASEDLKNDIEVVKAAVKQNSGALQYANRDCVSKMVAEDGMLLEYASEDLKNDLEVVKAAVKQNSGALQYANRDCVSKMVSEKGMLLEYASEKLKSDKGVVQTAMASDPTNLKFAKRDCVLKMVSENGLALEYASEVFKNDIEVVKAAVNQKSSALQFAKSGCVKEMVSEEGMLLEYASEELKSDKGVVQAAMASDPTNLKFAKRDCVLKMVSENGLALEYASEDLKNDIEVVKAAVNQKSSALQFAKSDCVKEMVSTDGSWLEFAGEFKNDINIVTASWKNKADALQYATKDRVLDVVSKHGLDLENAPEVFKDSPEVVQAAMKFHPTALKYATKNCVLTIISNHGLNLQYAPIELKEDVEVIKIAVEQNPESLKYASRDGVLNIVSENGMFLEYVPEELKTDLDVFIASIRSNGMALQFGSKEFKERLEFVKIAMESHPAALQFASNDCVVDLVSGDGLLLKYVGQEQLNQNSELILIAMEQNPAAIFELDNIENATLATRFVPGKSASPEAYPVPVTVQSKASEEFAIAAATYASFLNPNTHSFCTLVYKKQGVVSSKVDIDSDRVRHLPENLQESYSLYTKSKQTTYQHIKAYTALYAAASIEGMGERLDSQFESRPASVELFDEFLTFIEKKRKAKKVINEKLGVFRSTKQMSDKLKEKAWQNESDVQGSSKHILNYKFQDNLDFQEYKKALNHWTTIGKRETAKKNMLIFLCQHRQDIPDFTRVFHKLFHKSAKEIYDYLEKGTEPSSKPILRKMSLNEQIAEAETEPVGRVIFFHAKKHLQSDLNRDPETEDGKLELYTPPSCFGMREVDTSKMERLVEIWEEFETLKQPTDETLGELKDLMQTHFDHVMPSLVGMTKDMTTDKTEEIWKAVGEYVNSTYADSPKKEQIGHYLLCQLIIENNTDNFQTNYEQFRKHLDTDSEFWEAVESQFFARTYAKGDFLPNRQLALYANNEHAKNFFENQTP